MTNVSFKICQTVLSERKFARLLVQVAPGTPEYYVDVPADENGTVTPENLAYMFREMAKFHQPLPPTP